MPPKSPPRAARQGTAVVVLVISLAATAFATWREHEMVKREQFIRFQDGLAELNPTLVAWLAVRFEQLRDMAKATLCRDNYAESGWNEFLADSKWADRSHGMLEIGYAEFVDDKCFVKFVRSDISPPAHPVGCELTADPSLQATILKSADTGYGAASKPVMVGTGTNAIKVLFGVLPIPPLGKRPGTPAENRAQLRGFIYYALNQEEYFQMVLRQTVKMPFTYRLLAPDETAPSATPTQRVTGLTTITGEWRILATMKEPDAAKLVPQSLVALVGTFLSLLFYYLFAAQAKLRFAGQLANEKILEREAAEEKLQYALEREKELNRLKGNFVSMVTHEIRTPLAHIQGSSDILSRYLDRLPPEKRAQHFGFINSAVQRMSALMEDVLLFSKAEAGRMEFNPIGMDLGKFCHHLVDEVLSATNRRCPILVETDGVNEPARGDENLLRHVFTNLLTNAVKYSPPGTPVTLSVSRDKGMAVFMVQDRGMGIPEEDRKRLFTPFYRGKNVTSLPGTGLGLIIVKHCVQQHGGQIEIESAEGSGTKVCVHLPMFSPSHTEFFYRNPDSHSE